MNELLKRIGWTKRFFAEKVGVDESTVYRWGAGEAPVWVMIYLGLVDRLLNGVECKND